MDDTLLKKNMILNGIKTLVTMLFPLITTPYVSRILGAEGLGMVSFAQTINMYFMMIAALGVSHYAVREGAGLRNNLGIYEKFANEVFTINIISTVISYILLIISLLTIPKLVDYRLLILIFSFEILFTTLGVEWIFITFEEYGYITLRSILFKSISLAALFLFVRQKTDIIPYVIVIVFADVGSNILNFIKARKKIHVSLIFNFDISIHLKPIFILFLSGLAIQVYVASDITVLGFFKPDKVVGIYVMSSKIYGIIKTIISSVLIASIPRFSMLLRQNKINEFSKMFVVVFNYLIILVIPCMVGLFLLSEDIIFLIGGSEYLSGTSSLKMLSIALMFCLFGWLFNECVLIPARKEKIVLVSTIISAVVNLIINLLFIDRWGINAAAFSTIIAELIMAIICVYHGMKIVNINYYPVLKNFSTVLTASLGIIIVCLIVKSFNLSYIWNLVISIGFSIVSYFSILIVLKNESAIEILKKLKF